MTKESLADIESRMNIYNLCYWFINMGGVVAGNINRKVETIARPRPKPANPRTLIGQGEANGQEKVSYTQPGERMGITVISETEGKDE